MEFFTNLMNSVNGIIWSTALVALCLGAGLYFSIRMGFPQFRLFKEMVRLLTAQNKSGDGITPFQAFAAVLEPGDKILSMRLDQGGHLTHGSPANWVSKIYDYEIYGVNPETEEIDYDELDKIAKQCQPKLIIAGASSYSRLIDYERIAATAKTVGAYFMVDMAHIAGLVAAEVIPSPIPYADFVTSSTTKTFCSARSGTENGLGPNSMAPELS